MIEHATEVKPILLHIGPSKTAVFSRHTARSAVPSQSDVVCFGSKAEKAHPMQMFSALPG
jgi:hypothetical protein